jgi:hypothetical protein
MNKNKQKKLLRALRFVKKARFEFMSKLTIETAIKSEKAFELYDITEKWLLKNLLLISAS